MFLIAALLATVFLTPSSSQTPITLQAVFTPDPVPVDAKSNLAWDKAPSSDIDILVGAKSTTEKRIAAKVQALWCGPNLYLLFTVTDTEATARSGVQIFVDQDDDKFPKFEEDDSTITISATGRQTGNLTNAGLKYYPAAWSSHLLGYAAAPRLASDGSTIGYSVEVAWSVGDRPLKNGTKLGMEFIVNAAGAAPYQLHWSSAANHGLDDNTMWGDLELAGFDGKSPMPTNTFMLQQNVKKAKPAEVSEAGLVRGIWRDESNLDRAFGHASAILNKVRQGTARQDAIDAADRDLDKALRGLRRTGKYPDPYDLRSVPTLPDPFTFFDGKKVRSPADWDRRREEIKDLAQYYEFGQMPPTPKSLTATASSTAKAVHVTVSIQDGGRSATFQPVLYLPTAGVKPYPVIVVESFRSSIPPNPAFLRGGYAVLNIPTWDSPSFHFEGIASDDGDHTGAFYALYPYKLDTQGDDRGVLLAWAWGASRGVDALEYLAKHDPEYANMLDLKKLVVTGFSRWGKAALLAGLLDDRFQVTAPGGSGAGGAAPYRYDSFGNRPFRKAPFGNIYPWGRSPGAESFGDHVRHQTHNSNEMIRRFLNDAAPAPVEPRMYLTKTWGYADRLPYDHHELIAAIAPRAVIIDNTDDDYADNAEGDSIGFEGAKPVYKYLAVPQNLALDLFMGGGGHSLKPAQAQNIVDFANFVLYGKPLDPAVGKHLSTDPYLAAGTYDRYYGGLKRMMPWAFR